jgi:uncharacterized protein
MDAEVRFAADATVGRLAKWLRILGYDTTLSRERADSAFLLSAGREGRVALTRVREWATRQYQGRLLVVRADNIENQLMEVLDALGLTADPDRFFRLCLRCNEPLEAMRHEDAEGLVPVYVFENRRNFRRCPACRSVYWPGTHGEHARNGLIGRIRSRRP